MHQVHLVASGLVQGVFYRASCKEVAVKLDLKGWVRNLPSGEVEILAQGEREKLEQLIEWCRKGPPHAKITNIAVNWQDKTEDFTIFKIV